MKRPARLSATFVKTITVPGRFGDGRGGYGLSVLVKPTSTGRLSKTWAQRIRIEGTSHNIGLGSYPVVSLALARARALENWQAIEEGRNPLHERAVRVPTFSDAMEKVIATHSGAWKPGSKSEAQWRASMRDYALPCLGAMPVDKITTADVLAALTPIWNEKRETARRVRHRIGAVMKWAVAQGHRPDNPAGDAIAAALPKVRQRRTHHRALPCAEVAGTLAKVRGSDAVLSTKLALEFLALTAARSGEVRNAVWAEMDLPRATWVVPAGRAKTGREHRVPLSGRSLGVLDEARELRDQSHLVFPSVRGKPISDNTLSKLFRELEIPGVPHGLRSSFRDWCAETGGDRDAAEACLAHSLGPVESAYARSDLFERRRMLMEQWAQYLAGGNAGTDAVR